MKAGGFGIPANILLGITGRQASERLSTGLSSLHLHFPGKTINLLCYFRSLLVAQLFLLQPALQGEEDHLLTVLITGVEVCRRIFWFHEGIRCSSITVF